MGVLNKTVNTSPNLFSSKFDKFALQLFRIWFSNREQRKSHQESSKLCCSHIINK